MLNLQPTLYNLVKWITDSLLYWLKIFEVAPTYFMVDIQKADGDASEFLKVSF